jgi:hypothetical protein
MRLRYEPLLAVQREIYRLPRSMERFQEYLRTMLNERGDDLALPLSGMNPMAKEHVPALLDRYLELDADAIAARAVGETKVTGEGDYKVALVLSDDLKGGWTNRYAAEFSDRFGQRALRARGWIVAALWSSEEPSPDRVRMTVLAAIHRTSWIASHGETTTLRDRMQQEGYALHRAGHTVTLDAEELAYTRDVLEPLGESSDMATTIAALFGDAAADSLGMRRLGLSPQAGLELAIHNAVAASTRRP